MMAACSNIEYFFLGSAMEAAYPSGTYQITTRFKNMEWRDLVLSAVERTLERARFPHLTARYLLPVSFPAPHQDPHALNVHFERETQCFRFLQVRFLGYHDIVRITGFWDVISCNFECRQTFRRDLPLVSSGYTITYVTICSTRILGMREL